jgi:hypothetical protein
VTISAAARSISLVCIADRFDARRESQFNAILGEARRVLSLEGNLLLSLPIPAAHTPEQISSLLAVYGFAIVTNDRPRIVSQFNWVPDMRRLKSTDQYLWAKCI